MSVYVDNMAAPFGRLIMCHMIADTSEELHAMADRIGVVCLSSPEWCEANPRPGREKIERGAVEWYELPAGREDA